MGPPIRRGRGENGFGNVSYDGPRPPEEHTYRFEPYALDATFDVEDGASKEALGDAMAGHVLAQNQLTGTFAP